MESEGGDQILVVTDIGQAPASGYVERGLGDRLLGAGTSAIDVSSLKRNMERFFAQLQEILQAGGERVGPFALDQIEVHAQVNGEGKVCLLGSGGKLGVQGGIKFVLKRAPKS